jgi:hypothetical protein
MLFLGPTGSFVLLSNGKNTKFFTNRWASECALMSSYFQLFQLCTDLHITVHEVIISAPQALAFKRALTGMLLLEFNEICTMVRQINLIDKSDQLKWRVSPSGCFISHDVYEWLMFRDITDNSANK